MPIYLYRADDGEEIERYYPVGQAPSYITPTRGSLSISPGGECSAVTCETKVFNRVFATAGMKMPAETTSPAYQKWFHSEATQSKLKSGEYQIAGKDHNVNHL